MSCHTTVCLGTFRTADGVPIELRTSPRSGATIGASIRGTALAAETVLPCAVPSKLAAQLYTAMTGYASTASQAATFYLLGASLTDPRFTDLVTSHLVRSLLTSTAQDRPAAADGSVPTSAAARECLIFTAEDDDSVTCETLTADDTSATINRVVGRLHSITLVAVRFDGCVCLVVVSAQMTTTHIASLVSSATRAPSCTSIYLYLTETMTAADMRMACSELEAIKATVTDFTAPLRHTDPPAPVRDRAWPSLSEPPPSVSRVLNTTVSDDGRRDGGLELDAPPPLRLRGTQEAEREVRWLREELARVEADRDAAEMERRACQGVLQSYRERFSDMSPRDVALLRAISSGDQVADAVPYQSQDALVARLSEQLDHARRALEASEDRVRLLEFRGEMSGGSQRPLSTVGNSFGSAEALEALRRENLDLAALLQEKEREAAATIDALRAQLAESERANADLVRALETQSQTIREAKKAFVAERARHDAELAGALDAVKALSRDNSRSATNSSPHRSVAPVPSPSSVPLGSGRRRRYASPHQLSCAPEGIDARPSSTLDSSIANKDRRSIPQVLTSPPR